MKPARRLRWCIVMLAIACSLVSCDEGPVSDSHRPSSAIPFDAQRVLLELQQTWSSTGPGMGGFGNVHSLEAQPSLFETSWRLRVASAVRATLPNLSKAEASAWIMDDIRGAPVNGARRLEQLNLSVAALRGLGLDIPPDALAAIASLRTGQLYAFDPGQPTSWDATALAVLTLTDAGAPTPPDLADAVRRALPAATAADGWMDRLLPVWAVADLVLSPAERAAQRGRLSSALASIRGWAATAPMGEEAMFVVAQVNDIARLNSLPDAMTPLAAVSPLVSPNGYLVAGVNDPTPSMTNTYYALTMGYAPPGSHARDMLTAYLQVSVGPKGWRQDVGRPEPTTSFYTWEVYRALGETAPESALSREVAAWLRAYATAKTWRDLEPQTEAYFVFLLAKSLNLQLPAAVFRLVSAELEGSDGQLSPHELVDLARESLVLGLPAGAFVQHAWRSLESGYDVANIRGAEDALTVWLALGDPAGLANLRTRLTAAHAEILWRAAPGVPIPDLMSAATGATIVGRSPSLATAVNQTFLDQHGYWLLPTTVSQNNVVEPMTLYFGLWLTGANVDGGGVIL